jgi:predicted membrane protein
MFHIAAIVYLTTRLIVLTGDGLLASILIKEDMFLFAIFALIFTIISIAFAILCVFISERNLSRYCKAKAQMTYLL